MLLWTAISPAVSRLISNEFGTLVRVMLGIPLAVSWCKNYIMRMNEFIISSVQGVPIKIHYPFGML